MKATMFAVVLSCLVLSLSTQAIAQDAKTTAQPVVEQTLKKLNLNKATVQELTGSFKGVGLKRAEAIVAFREAHGGIKSVEELAQVRGLGKAFVDSHLVQLQEAYAID